jgi:hypothetical protein
MKSTKDINSSEIVFDNIPEFDVPEIKVRFNRSKQKRFEGSIKSPIDTVRFIRKTFQRGSIELQEHFIVVYLNQANRVLGYYKHTIGGINEVTADARLIIAVGLKCTALSMILAHNHPSGNITPSKKDIEFTNSIKKAANSVGIRVLDHLIVTDTSYLSFKDEGLTGVPEKNSLDENFKEFVGYVEKDLQIGYKHNKRSIEALAYSLNISDKTEIKELTELAIVNVARKLAHSNKTVREKFESIVDLYNNQMILSHRTSQSILLQQYSTPAPIAYLMGVFCGLPHLQQTGGYAFEPSAGNGLLTIAAKPERVYVNEVDYTRNRNLHTQGFANVFNRDATLPFSYIDLQGTFSAVLTNPPFGTLDKAIDYNTFPIKVLDHLMSLRALDAMAPDGKAAIIIGGHTRWDSLGRIEKGKNRIYFNYLYRHYHVTDVIQIDGHRLYTRQGTGFPVRLILIEGRKQKPTGVAPVKNEQTDKVIRSFDALYERVMQWVNEEKKSEQQLFITAAFEKKYFQLKEKYPDALILMRDNEEYKAIAEDAKVFSHHTKIIYQPYANSKGIFIPVASIELNQLDKIIHQLSHAGQKVAIVDELTLPTKNMNIKELEKEAEELLKLFRENELGMPYTPASNACVVLNTQVPDSMGFETQAALTRIKSEVGGSMDNFVRHRLAYASHTALCKALSAEQIDAVAMAIYNIEAREQGTIIGDQTGIGKGRIAAAMIRYGVKRGLKPVFITEKSNLFSDIYRDLVAIGSAELKPFIINGRESKTDIKDEDGNIVHQALAASEQSSIFQTKKIPAWCDFVVGTYSQFNSPEKKPEKPNFLMHIANGNLLIMDEAHNSSGSSNTGEFMQGVIKDTLGVVFLSATFAKRPDNMPIYAMKTAISEANLSKEDLVDAIQKGGVALQEILSSQLVAEGQMIRRERSFEGIEVNYISLDNYEAQHRKTADSITKILRDIIAFQKNYIDKEVAELDKIAAAEGKEIDLREGTSQAGVDNIPYFSKVFNVINQMLFSIKADAVADRAIERLKEGKKPVIAFASTMGSFIEQMENEQGLAVGDGDLINTDFAEVLRRGLDGVMRYTERDINGDSSYKRFDIAELDEDARKEYLRILQEIDVVSTGVSISPIDIVIQKLEKAGYTVAEVTGRKFTIQLNAKGNKGLVIARKRINTNDAFRMFNNNEVDVLMINQSGSTGASAHAIVTPNVPAEQVKQRVMIVLQAELDINTEVQKRGRINRTGQILKPIYDYVISSIPAEKRLMMMLQKKLKSLDANTTSNQKQSTKILDVPDFLNKYGDKVAQEYLSENPDINELLGKPLTSSFSKQDEAGEKHVEDAAHRVSGRVAVLSTQMQADFYNEITERYNEYVEYLKQIGDYDLEVEAIDLQAETLETSIIKMGKGGESAFGDDSILEKVRANILRKPFNKAELENLLNETLAGKSAEEHKRLLLQDFNLNVEQRREEAIKGIADKYDGLIKDVPNEKKVLKVLEKQGEGAYQKMILEREKELEGARKLALEQMQKSMANKKTYLQRVLNFFTIGRKLSYPVVTYANGSEHVLAVCIGIMVDRKKKNPYARSAIKIRLAIANSRKYIAMPSSFDESISSIMAASFDIVTPSSQVLLNEWEEEIKQKTKDRGIRYIITGNLLQAFNDSSGKLVSYTTMDGQTKKGLLMPEEWQGDETDQNITVPIVKALPILKSMTNGSKLVGSGNISFFKSGDTYHIITSSARSRSGDVYMDKEIWSLIKNEKFESVSNSMKAILPEQNIEALADLLQKNHNVSVEVNPQQLKFLKPNSERVSTRKKIELPPNEEEAERERIRILELEAEAILLELELAA